MPKKIAPLTDTQVKAAKPDKIDYPLYDGNGLLLLIKATGTKIWQFRYYKPITNKRTTVSIGNYPETSLQQARAKREEYRALIKQGVDPLDHKAELERQKAEDSQNTFKYVAEQWFKVKSSRGLSQSTLDRTWRSLEIYLFPSIGNRSIVKIRARDFISVLSPLGATGKLETIKRLAQRINEIMFYAVNIGVIEANPAARISMAFESPIKNNMPTIKPDQLPVFLKSLSLARIELATRCLIEWQLLTLTRPSEAVGAKWEEIDFINKLWTIPDIRMKMKREHIIPLNSQALALLDIMKPISGHREHVFPSMKPPYSSPMNSSTANMAIKRMGYKGLLVAHGLRALASTILNEQGFNPDVIERALAHIDTNEVRRAYNRATYLEQRKIMMDWWGQFVEDASNGSVSLSGNKALKIVNH